MGSIVFSAGELPQTLGEVTGYKAGIALTLDELLNHLSTESREVVSEAVQSVARIESYVFAELSAELLFAIGNISSPTAVPSCVQLFHKYRADSQLSQTYGAVLDRFTAFLEEGSRAGVSRIDGGAFAERVGDELGTRAQSMARVGRRGCRGHAEEAVGPLPPC